MKIWREVHGGSIRRATILTTSMPVMETTLLVVIDNIGCDSQHKRMNVKFDKYLYSERKSFRTTHSIPKVVKTHPNH
jgi:hypothetical protein